MARHTYSNRHKHHHIQKGKHSIGYINPLHESSWIEKIIDFIKRLWK